MEKVGLEETDRLKEEIRFKTERLKVAAGTGIVIAGGTISLMIDGPNKGGEILFCAFGIITVVLIVRFCYKEHLKLRELIRL